MKRSISIALLALPLMTLAAPPAYAEVKTRDKTQVKFEGMLGRMFNLFGGKSAKEGIEGKTAVKGSRKATLTDSGGTIVDLSEEKIYDIDAKKKQYTVTTFEELRRRMREAREKAMKEAEKEEPGKKGEAQKPSKEYEVDFDVKDTGERKSIAGYDTKNTIVTITVREKGKTLEEAGGLVMTNDMWLGPALPQLKELYEFDLKYAKQLQGPEAAALSAEQMATVLAMFPLVGKAMDRMQKDADKLSGTPLVTTMTFEAVKTQEQVAQEQQSSSGSGSSSGGGLGGMLARKMIKKEDPKARATIMTTRHEVLEVSTSVAAADLAIPADYKEKK